MSGTPNLLPPGAPLCCASAVPTSLEQDGFSSVVLLQCLLFVVGKHQAGDQHTGDYGAMAQRGSLVALDARQVDRQRALSRCSGLVVVGPD